MSDAQLPIFGRKKFDSVVSVQAAVLEPTGESSILMTLPAYMVHLQSGEYSRHTPRVFHSDIKHLGLYLRGKKLGELKPMDIKQWIGELKVSKEKVLAPKTISRKITAVNNYLSWLVDIGILAENKDWFLRNMRVDAPLPYILFDAECKQLLATASRDPRSYLLILLLLETGIKKEELLALRKGNFDFSNAYEPEMLIRHEGKKVAKDRTLKLPMQVVAAFTEYVEKYSIDDVLFPYTPRHIEALTTMLAKEAGIQKRVNAGILRDTCAVRALKRGQDMEKVLARLGLSESTWKDAHLKYLKLSARGI